MITVPTTNKLALPVSKQTPTHPGGTAPGQSIPCVPWRCGKLGWLWIAQADVDNLGTLEKIGGLGNAMGLGGGRAIRTGRAGLGGGRAIGPHSGAGMR